MLILRLLLSCIAVLALPFAMAMATEQAPEDNEQQLSSVLHIGGSVRYRYESQLNVQFGTPSLANSQDYGLQQLRLHMLWKPTAMMDFFIEVQDARVLQGFRGHQIDRRKTPNIYEDHLDIHQAYLDLIIPDMSQSVSIRVGRQKFNFGAQRLIASLEWVNTARVWDAAKVHIQWDDQQSLDAFASLLVPVNPIALNRHRYTKSRMFNSRFYGLYYTNKEGLLADTTIDFYALLRQEHSIGDRVFTWGHRSTYQYHDWDFDDELMLQTGRYGQDAQHAYAAHFGIGYRLSH